MVVQVAVRGVANVSAKSLSLRIVVIVRCPWCCRVNADN